MSNNILLWWVAIYFWTIISMTICETDKLCRQGIYQKIGQGGPITADVISSFSVYGMVECGQQCLGKSTCVSFNYKSTYTEDEANCQLVNKSTDRLAYLLSLPSNDINNSWTLYIIQEVRPHMCVNRCENGGKCVANPCKSEGYTCQCERKYLGKNCENELKEDYDINFQGKTKNDYVMIPVEKGPFGGLTFSTWLKIEPDLQKYHLLSYMANENRGFELSFNTPCNREPEYRSVTCRFECSILTRKVRTNIIPVNDGYWHHLGVIWSNTEGRWSVLIDGVLWVLRSNIAVGGHIPGGGTLLVGQKQTKSGSNFLHTLVGVISRLNLWDRALSEAELEKLARIPGNESGSLLSWTNFVDYLFEGADVIIPSKARNTVSEVNYKLIFKSPATGKDYVSFSGVHESLNSMSSCMWIRTRSSECWFFSYISEETQTVLAFGYDSNRYYTIQLNTTLVHSSIPKSNINDNTWHFVCFTWSGKDGQVSFYHDGRRHGSVIQENGTITKLQPGGIFTTGSKLNFSRGLIKKMDGFTGEMSQFNVWYSVLSYSSVFTMSSGGANVNGDLVSWRNLAKGIVGHIPVKRMFDIFLPGYTVLSKRSKWCNDHINSTCGTLFARFGEGGNETGMYWRCYCEEALTPSKYTYNFQGKTTAFFTRHDELVNIKN